MGTRRCALRDVLTMEQYRELLREAARIEDRVESISLFFFLVTMGRLGMRVGEVIHMRESWYKEDRGVISIPPHSNCDCGLCKHYAESYAKEHDLDVDDVLENYWKVKDESDRDVKVPTERDREIIELYFEEVPFTDVSYSTVNRRLKKIAEIVGEPEVHRMYPHMLRATAATHLAHSGFLPYALDVQFGWSDENTKTKYIRATGLLVEREYDRMWGRDEEEDPDLREHPPTFSELRPDDERGLRAVESWAVDADVDTHPRTRDEEPLLRSLDEFGSWEEPAATEPVSPAVKARLADERVMIDNSPDHGFSRKRTAAAGGGLFLGATIFGTTWALNGQLEAIMTGEPMAVASAVIAGTIALPMMVWQTHETFHDDPQAVEPESYVDKAIVKTHAAVDKLVSPVRAVFGEKS